jgi:hypothetical protein
VELVVAELVDGVAGGFQRIAAEMEHHHALVRKGQGQAAGGLGAGELGPDGLGPRAGAVFGDLDQPVQSRPRHRGEELLAVRAGEAHDFAPHRAARDEARGAPVIGGDPDDVGELVEGDACPCGQAFAEPASRSGALGRSSPEPLGWRLTSSTM